MTLAEALGSVLADTFKMYMKAHKHHFNVTGVGFPYYHEFFGDIYQDVYGALDPTSENIRKLGEMVQFDAEWMLVNSDIKNRITINAHAMCQDLYDANEVVLNSLNLAFTIADNSNEQGIANFLADRIDQHQKHRWMLKSSMKEK